MKNMAFYSLHSQMQKEEKTASVVHALQDQMNLPISTKTDRLMSFDLP
jgi:hypothetical protein